MNNSLIHKVVALLLSFLMFFTSIGYSMDIHYCKGEVEDVSFFGEVTSCEMQTEESTSLKECCHASDVRESQCKNHSIGDGIQKEDCCKDEVLVLSVEDFSVARSIEASIHKLLIFPISFLYALALSERVDVLHEDDSTYYYRSYFPTRELHLLHQVFII